MSATDLKRNILFTGFPGFIGKRLVEKLLFTQPDCFIYLLVEPRFAGRARDVICNLAKTLPDADKRLSILEGDIARAGLGLASALLNSLSTEVNTIFHLAAIYNLAVKKEVAYSVNVTGTIEILNFAEQCKNLERLNYFSTCYVAGKREGIIKEEELNGSAGFKNYYEETKYLAEVEVRKRMDRIPTTIYRPGIVVGDSKTGEVDKYDGPYYGIAALARLERNGKLRKNIPLVHIGRKDVPFFLVPIDFVVDASVFISMQKESAGKTYQIVDPAPMTFREFFTLTAKLFGLPEPKITLPAWVAKPLIWFPKLLRGFQVLPEVLPYGNCAAIYDSSNTQEILKNIGLSCPPIRSYFPKLVEYVRAHPEKMVVL